MNVSFEVEPDRSIMVVLDRPADCVLIPYQDAFDLADSLELAINDARDENDLINVPALKREQEQIKIGVHAGQVSLVFGWCDRLRYTWRSAELLMQAIRLKGQGVQYLVEKAMLLPTLSHGQAARALQHAH